MAGFGGVAEYGITVRWDKNFLKLVRLLLERRAAVLDVRRRALRRHGDGRERLRAWASTTSRSCAGAGKPTVLDMPNGLARGVRAASDFLMALQLTGAAKTDSIANLQIRLPVVVIGGGLTAIDTATESLAYYPLQVEKFLARYEALAAERGEAAVRADWSDEEREIARRVPRARPRGARRARGGRARGPRRPTSPRWCNGWGGVTIAYRRRLIDARPTRSTTRKSQGARGGHPLRRGPVAGRGRGRRQRRTPAALKVAGEQDGEKVEATLPARTILVAAGTQPNTVLAREDATHAFIDGKYFRALDEDGEPVDARAASASRPRCAC